MTITIWHNPRCAKSRQALELLRGRGLEPTIVEYLKTPPSAAELKRVLKLLGKTPRDILRKKEAAEAGIDAAALSDDALVAAMAKHPVVIERPIVVKDDRAALGRPPEDVLALL